MLLTLRSTTQQQQEQTWEADVCLAPPTQGLSVSSTQPDKSSIGITSAGCAMRFLNLHLMKWARAAKVGFQPFHKYARLLTQSFVTYKRHCCAYYCMHRALRTPQCLRSFTQALFRHVNNPTARISVFAASSSNPNILSPGLLSIDRLPYAGSSPAARLASSMASDQEVRQKKYPCQLMEFLCLSCRE